MISLQKIRLLLILLSYVTYTYQQLKDPAFMEKWNKNRADCAKEEGVDLAAIQKAWDANSFPDDKKFKCFYKCTSTKLGFLDASGEVVDDALGIVAAQFNDKATKEEIVQECGPLKGTDLCETAYLLLKCIKAAKLD